MTVTDVTTIEGTGSGFEMDGFMAVRARTRKAVHMIAEQIAPGMSEDEAKKIARSTLASLEMRRGWHHIIVRCGPNTTKDFMERSEPGVVLRDVGPGRGQGIAAASTPRSLTTRPARRRTALAVPSGRQTRFTQKCMP